MPSRASSGTPGSAVQKEHEQAGDASGPALDSSTAEKGADTRDAAKEQRQKGGTSDSRSSRPRQRNGVERSALPGSALEQSEVPVRVDEHLTDKRRTAGAAPHPESSQTPTDTPAASSESRQRRITSSIGRGSRPQARAAQDAHGGQKDRSTAHRVPQESKVPAPRSRKGDAALPHSLVPQSTAILVPSIYLPSHFSEYCISPRWDGCQAWQTGPLQGLLQCLLGVPCLLSRKV